MTNAERLAGNPEELALILREHDDCCDYCSLQGGCDVGEDCAARILEWLLMEGD